MPQDVATPMSRGVNGISHLNSRQVQIVSVTSMLIFLSTLAVGLRFVSRRISTGKFYMDDYVIVFALVGEIAFGLGCGNLTSVSSCYHMETAFVSLSVSGGVLIADMHKDN